ncbi:Bile acid:sodium symporter/arsenical resistance protein Acr3 [Trinorchestia longiramus]|nr:Bile acid:sodium symporter/arsenical resistance protein Acr3 [Trinorchestia longiramus]
MTERNYLDLVCYIYGSDTRLTQGSFRFLKENYNVLFSSTIHTFVERTAVNMCPLYPVHLLLLYGALLALLWSVTGERLGVRVTGERLGVRVTGERLGVRVTGERLGVTVTGERLGVRVTGAAVVKALTLSARLAVNGSAVSQIDLAEGKRLNVSFLVGNIPADYSGTLKVLSPDGTKHLSVEPDVYEVTQTFTTAEEPADFPLPPASNTTQVVYDGRFFSGDFEASGEFLGFSKLKFVLSNGSNDEELMESEEIDVKVERGPRVLDKIFVHVVVLLVIILYVNMGCTIELDIVKSTLRRPVAPLIGLLCQYIFMPLCSYGLGYAFLSTTPALWLGLFVTGCSPGGGGSNMWTYLLGGSLDLSVTMTFISTVAAFVAMPCWIWALAPTIFEEGKFNSPPYRNIAMLALGLVVPISIGLLIKAKCPKAAAVLRKLLKPLSLFFIIFVMTFGVYAYWYIFEFFTWKVAVCGFSLPLLGFTAGAGAAVASRRDLSQVIAISVETGLQNTGLAIGLLKIALSSFSPLGDIAMVVPVAVASLTPLPLLVAYLITWIRGKRYGKSYDTHAQLNSETSCSTS